MITGYINKDVQKLIESFQNQGIELEVDTVQVWIEEASDYDCISKIDLMNINSYLIEHGNSIDTLIKVYSYLNSIIDDNDVYDE